jgi:hypothetical protein
VLLRHLLLVGEVLEPAAAARGVVRARRVDVFLPDSDDLGRDGLGVVPLHLRYPRLHGVAGQAAADEDDEPVQPRDAVPAVREGLDRDLDLVVDADGRGHRSRLPTRRS